MNNSRINDRDDIQSALRFINYVVDSVEFYNNEEFDEESSVSIDFKIGRNIQYSKEDNSMFVTLKVAIFENPQENNYPFSMNIEITGIFEVEGVDEERRSNIAEVNAVAILFPYVRALVSTFTANSNVMPLILPPVNVVKLIEAQSD